MNEVAARKALQHWLVELEQVRAFFRKRKSVQQWQDWLRWRSGKVPRTVKPSPMASVMDHPVFKDVAVRYQNVLTVAVAAGYVRRERTRDMTYYEWVDNESAV